MPSFYTMKNNKDSISRRDFLAATGAIGVGAILASSRISGADLRRQAIPPRELGNTGVEVPIIGLGCMFNIINNQVILRQAFGRGGTYWDTAAGYGKGG